MKKYKRRFLSFICIAIIVFVTTGRKAMATSLLKIDLNQLEGKLVILHTNDTHGFLLENSERSFDAASLNIIKRIFESLGADVLLVDSGDTIFGTPMFDKKLGVKMVEQINEIEYDAITTGNHDFDYGGKKLLDVSLQLTNPLLVANVVDTSTKKLVFNPYRFIKKGDYCVGIFGITTQEEVTGFEKYGESSFTISDPIEAAKEASSKLKKGGADFIIALGHIGMDGRSELSSVDIITEVPGIDLFVDAHSHSSLKLRLIHEDGSQTLLVRNRHYFSEIGVVIVGDDRYMQCFTIDKSNMEKFIEKFNAVQ